MRRFRSSICLAAALLIGPAAVGPSAAAADGGVFLATDASSAGTQRVQVVVEAAGELKFKEKEAVKSATTSVAARYAYDEKRLPDAEGWAQSVRRMRTVEPKFVVDKTTITPQLREERRLVVVRRTEAQPQVHSPMGPLSTDELELLQLPFDSLLIDELLPAKEVALKESWKHDDALMCALLNLDAVSKSDVTSTLTDAADDLARIEFKGLVQGALGGVTAEFDVVGRYTFDRTTHRISWLAVLLKEKRAIGHVEPGVDATTRVQMTLAPTAEPPDLSSNELRDLTLEPLPELLRLAYTSGTAGYSLEHDRRWSVMTDDREMLALRLVDRGELVAQCNVRSIMVPDATKRPTLTQFQADVRRSLDKNFQQFVRVGESENSIGQTVYRAEAVGTVEELEIHWIYYLVLDPGGRQVVLAFTVEQPMLERFEGTDAAMISTVRFQTESATIGSATGSSTQR